MTIGDVFFLFGPKTLRFLLPCFLLQNLFRTHFFSVQTEVVMRCSKSMCLQVE